MLRYLISKLAGLAGVLIVVSLMTFVLMHNVPGGPFDARALEKQQMVPDAIKTQLNIKYGLDAPVWKQYLLFVKNAVLLDFGYSMTYPSRTVTSIFKQQWLYSIQLGLLTLAFSVVVGVGLGILSAVRPNSIFDYFSTGISIFCMVVPGFIFAILLQVVFSVWLGWLPTGGWRTPWHWIMPTLANSLAPILVLQRHTRASMLEAFEGQFVRTARAKGLSTSRILFVHVLKNGLLPILTVGGPLAAGLIVGSFFVESIFRIPGIGFYFVTAIGTRDYPMIMATTLIWTLIISVAYIVTDLLYAVADPRVTLSNDDRTN
jgi:peptide/nickel transport system permease protein